MKTDAYKMLVRDRKTCRLCSPGLTNPAEIKKGEYDSDHLGPWSRWHGSLSAKVVVVGQDWADRETFCRSEGLDDNTNRTNRVVLGWLRDLGIEVQPDTNGGQGPAFLTNAILCLKTGRMSEAVTDRWAMNCGPRFLCPLIDLIRPRLVLTLGRVAWDTVRELYVLPPLPLKEAVTRTEGFPLSEETICFPLYHPATWANVRSRRQLAADWQRVVAFARATDVLK